MINLLWKWLHKRNEIKTDITQNSILISRYAGYIFRRVPQSFESVLDVGIGSGWLGGVMKSVYGARVDGIELYIPYVENAERTYDNVIAKDISWALYEIPDKSYDLVFCLETIEHIEDGKYIISELERIAKLAVFISTPVIYFNNLSWDGNPYQIHRCLLKPRYLKKLGYNIEGCGTLYAWLGAVGRKLYFLDDDYFAWKYF